MGPRWRACHGCQWRRPSDPCCNGWGCPMGVRVRRPPRASPGRKGRNTRRLRRAESAASHGASRPRGCWGANCPALLRFQHIGRALKAHRSRAAEAGVCVPRLPLAGSRRRHAEVVGGCCGSGAGSVDLGLRCRCRCCHSGWPALRLRWRQRSSALAASAAAVAARISLSLALTAGSSCWVVSPWTVAAVAAARLASPLARGRRRL